MCLISPWWSSWTGSASVKLEVEAERHWSTSTHRAENQQPGWTHTRVQLWTDFVPLTNRKSCLCSFVRRHMRSKCLRPQARGLVPYSRFVMCLCNDDIRIIFISLRCWNFSHSVHQHPVLFHFGSGCCGCQYNSPVLLCCLGLLLGFVSFRCCEWNSDMC